MQPFTAYAIQSSDLTGDYLEKNLRRSLTKNYHFKFVDPKGKGQYLKTQVRGGQLFQLRAVFQHQDRSESGRHSTKSSRILRSARDKDLANRYAQLISQNNQVLFQETFFKFYIDFN